MVTKTIISVKTNEFLETYLDSLAGKSVDNLSPAQLRTIVKLMLKRSDKLGKENVILPS